MEIPARLRQDDWQRFTVSKSSRCEGEFSLVQRPPCRSGSEFHTQNLLVWPLPRCSSGEVSLWCIHVNTLPPCSCIHCAVDFLTSVVAEQQTAEKGFEEQKNQLRFLTNVKSDGLGCAVFGADAGE